MSLGKHFALLIPVTGEWQVLQDTPTLEEAQKLIDGYVEMRQFSVDGVRVQALFNEDGLRKEMQINLPASVMVGIQLVGPVILLAGKRKWT